MRQKSTHKLVLVLAVILLIGTGIAVQQAAAGGALSPSQQASPIHPNFPLLDAEGTPVLESGTAVSTMKTCGSCHDTEFIAGHSFHSDLGLSDFTEAGQVPGGRPWDQSNGLFGRWNPLTYRLLSPEGDETIDLTTAEWLKVFGSRVVGGGPAVTGRDGQPLAASDSAGDGWDWHESGVVEMNCFLCHLGSPNNAEREAALRAGEFSWANTATLVGTGLAEKTGDGYSWNREAFDENGELAPQKVSIQDPTNDNCAQCHGVVHSGDEPLTFSACDLTDWQTATTGQVISPDKITQSGINLQNKEEINRSWDIHAERGLQCTDCHYSINNPVYYQETGESKPGHLTFDPRRLELGEYLKKPDHNLARGQSAQFTIAPELKGTMRRCESCHNAVDTHDWLPYAERHMVELACESCHAPHLYAPAVQSYDWTTLKADGTPLVACRGVQESASAQQALITGFTPVLMPRQNIDGGTPLAPYNLVTAWYWVYDSPDGERPVRQSDLEAAFFENGGYAAEVLAAFDQDDDGSLNETELKLDNSEKQAVIASRLAQLGLDNPRIAGEIQPYSINHNIASGEWAISDCKACHNDESKVAVPILLASSIPGGVQPEFVQDNNTTSDGAIYTQDGALYYQPISQSHELYVFGHSRVSWIDILGALFFVGVLVAVMVHGGLRLYAAIKSPHSKPETKKVYMYGVYERFWHWLQTIVIVLLLFSGLIIHRPDIFGWFSFRNVVLVHNVLAALLVINAGLSLFYHLASGEIRQFIPRPYGFFDQAIVQAKYYLQGIFKGKGHPFEKTPEKKLNPLQQVTYFGILNVLLPLQIITGALMWGVQRWPSFANALGGLPVLAPFHSLVAWVFAGFIVGHVYLTTTGAEPLTAINAMMTGWEDVEIEEHSSEEAQAEEDTSEEQPGETPDLNAGNSPAVVL